MVRYAIFRLARKRRLLKETQKASAAKVSFIGVFGDSGERRNGRNEYILCEGEGLPLASLPKGRITPTALSHAPFLNDLDK